MTHITWTWIEPSDPDFEHVEIYLNNSFKTNVSSGNQSYTATNLTPGTQYTIGTKTVDTAGNVNASMVTAVATTAADTTAPVITLNGNNTVNVEINTPYTEAGATVTDNYDTGLTATITGSVNTEVVGVYTVIYKAIDSSGNFAIPLIRTVNVVDTTPPGIVNGLANDTPTQITVNLSWNPTANASQYQIFRNSSLRGNTQNTYWNETGLEPDTLYQYRVRANDSYDNWGENSSMLSVRTALPIPAPLVITITSPEKNIVNNTGFINITVALNRTGTAFLNWEGSNESMVGNGTYFHTNKTGLLSGTYNFKIYANDTKGVPSGSETRIVIVNRTIIDNKIGNSINTSTFIVNTTLEIASPSGNTTLIISNGTNASVSGSPVTSISIDSVAKINSTFAALAGNDKFIGENVTFGPSGAVFNPPIQIQFNYTDAQLNADQITASQLRVKFYNTTTNTWVEQTPYTLNETGKYIIANVSHFSTFVLLGTTTPTTTSNPPSSSGGGGGVGGGTSGEDFANILLKEKYDLQIYKDIVTSYKFTNVNNPILSINIVGNVNAGEIRTAVEVLRNTSSLIKTPAPGKVYQNVNVWVGTSGFGTPKNIKEAVITFRVPNSWISGNNIDISGIKIVRWDGSIWEQLETSEQKDDGTFTYYEAKTNAFSSFAITLLEEAVSNTLPQGTAQPGIPVNVTYTASTESTSEGAQPVNFTIIIIVFIVIGTVIVVYIKKRGNFKK